MKKVLHIVWNAKFGGIEKLVYDLVKAQNQEGTVQAEILVAKPEGEYLQQFLSLNTSVHTLNLSSGLSMNAASFRKAYSLFKRADCLHFHFFHPVLCYLALFTSAKVVFTEHGNFGIGRKARLSDKVVVGLKKRFLKHPRIFITYNSESTARFAEKIYQLNAPTQSRVIHNGLDFSSFTNTRIQQEEAASLHELTIRLKGRFVLGTSSRFAPVKRIDKLIRAFHKIQDKEGLALLLIGDGTLMPELQALVKDLGLQDYVVFTGYVESCHNFQSLMNLSIYPSEFETFGLAALESLALGIPALAYTNSGGIAEILRGLEPQDVVEDEEGLIKRIEYYQHKHEGQVERQARIRYARQFSIEGMAKKLETIY